MSNTNNQNAIGNTAPVFSDADFDGHTHSLELYDSSGEIDPEMAAVILAGLEMFNGG